MANTAATELGQARRPDASVTGTSWRILLPLFLVCVSAASYYNSFDGAFLLDDNHRIVDNLQIRKLWPPWLAMADSSRPILQITLAFSYALGGAQPWAYHAFNFAVHTSAGLVLFGLVRQMLDTPGALRARYGAAAPWLAFAVAAIWLAHPLQTESVTYIIQRAESLMGLFYLLALYCGIRACESAHPGRWGVAAVLACALGMGTKEVMVSAPFLMLLYDRTFISGSFKRALRAHWLLHAGFAASWLVLVASLAINRNEEQFLLVGGFDPWRYLWTQCTVIVHYLRLSLWPHPLVFDYAWPVDGPSISTLPAAVIVLVLLAGTLLALQRRLWVGFWGAWFFVILAPTSSIMPIADVAFEHRLYLPLAAVVAVAVIGGYDLVGFLGRRVNMSGSARGKLAGSLLGIALVALVFATVRRNDDYRSPIAMWRDTVAKRPDNPRAHNNLGVELIKEGKIGEALAHFAEAVRLKPDYADARNNLGGGLFKQGRNEEAIAQFTEAVRARPTFADAHGNLGTALLRAGRKEEAVVHYSQAARLNPGSSQAHNDLGNAFYLQGRIKEAAVQYGEAVRLQPGFAEAHHNLGLAALEQGDTQAAMRHFSDAIRLKPDYAKAQVNLGIALYRNGRVKEAIAHFSEAVRLDPTSADARNNLRAAEAMR